MIWEEVAMIRVVIDVIVKDRAVIWEDREMIWEDREMILVDKGD